MKLTAKEAAIIIAKFGYDPRGLPEVGEARLGRIVTMVNREQGVYWMGEQRVKLPRVKK
jgi:hypothetical protein